MFDNQGSAVINSGKHQLDTANIDLQSILKSKNITQEPKENRF